MQYKPAPRLEYHHVQPLAIRPLPHCPGDLNFQAMRERRKLQPVTMPDRSSFDIDLKNRRIDWLGFVEHFEKIEIRAW